MPLVASHLDYGHLKGGFVRMMDRYKNEGTLTGDPDADAFLHRHPNAALLGLLYDQRVRAEFAFTGPVRLHDRLGHLDLRRIAAMDEDAFRELFAERPAVHRFTGKMAETTQAVARRITEEYDGEAACLWNDGADVRTVEERVRALPGFGELKAAKVRFVLHYFGHRDFGDEGSGTGDEA